LSIISRAAFSGIGAAGSARSVREIVSRDFMNLRHAEQTSNGIFLITKQFLHAPIRIQGRLSV
jgi:hypothetical protein